MVNAKWCINNINAGDNMSFKAVKGEIIELLEARNFEDIKEEFGDVLYFTYCWIYSKYRLNLPMIGAMNSVKKFVARLDVWKVIFEKEGLEFNTKYLVNGSNYNKIQKVNLAISIARAEQGM